MGTLICIAQQLAIGYRVIKCQCLHESLICIAQLLAIGYRACGNGFVKSDEIWFELECTKHGSICMSHSSSVSVCMSHSSSVSVWIGHSSSVCVWMSHSSNIVVGMVVLRESKMIVWCVGPCSMRWVHSSAMREERSSVVQLDSRMVHHHTNLVFFLCHGFNHFWHWDIQNWS